MTSIFEPLVAHSRDEHASALPRLSRLTTTFAIATMRGLVFSRWFGPVSGIGRLRTCSARVSESGYAIEPSEINAHAPCRAKLNQTAVGVSRRSA